ncbi:MAG TPA: aminotransferase class V-fold PLP-dependent enzyme [Candidatus Saccharimonadales bacterium]|jgi:molybdenum cofactor sulfurtransferase|nr:aminotransferase class V-fold PLP-dependent enzyme [Candidatus Saccharimonadales bacterium]
MAESVAQEKIQLEEARADFLTRFPGYKNTSLLDDHRATEYRRLDERGHVYLDYTGGSLWAESQIQKHFELLRSSVLGNPHSASPASVAMTEHVERTRRAILQYFNARPDDYILVFTQNATAGLKLIGESFPFAASSRYLLTFDNHNSVNGIREFARAKGATIEYAPLAMPDLRMDAGRLDAVLDKGAMRHANLFAYPAQSNFSGVKHPLDLVAKAQSKGWRVLLDAAAFVPTNRLDLSATQPDFVTLSFYKMFGYPTGVGALLVRRSALPLLKRPWFAGGTVNFASVQGQAHVLSPNEAAFEDGTLNYLSIPAVEIGLRHLESIGIDMIAERVRCLTGWLLEELLALRHTNGRAMVRIYGPATTQARGGTVTLNLYDPQGHLLDYRRVEELAGAENISLRTGCFCNPGAGETAEGLTEADMQAGFTMGAEINLLSFVRMMQERGHKSAGAIRASIGIATNFADVWRFLRFIAGFRDQTRLTIGDVSFDIESCRIIRDGS